MLSDTSTALSLTTDRLPAARIVTVSEPLTVLPGRGWMNRPFPEMGADYEAAQVKDNRTGYVYRIVGQHGHEQRFLAIVCNCGAPLHKGRDGDATKCAHVVAYVRSVVSR